MARRLLQGKSHRLFSVHRYNSSMKDDAISGDPKIGSGHSISLQLAETMSGLICMIKAKKNISKRISNILLRT